MSDIGSLIEIWKWRAGGRRDFWIVNAEIVGKFINSNKIKPVSRETLQTKAASKNIEIAGDERFFQWWWKAGGIRAAHLHFNGEIYLLNAKQWNAFSTRLIEDFSKKLAQANTISYKQFMDIADTISEIPVATD